MAELEKRIVFIIVITKILKLNCSSLKILIYPTGQGASAFITTVSMVCSSYKIFVYKRHAKSYCYSLVFFSMFMFFVTYLWYMAGLAWIFEGYHIVSGTDDFKNEFLS